MYVDPMDFVLSLVGIYFLGYSVEKRIRRRRFTHYFFGSIIFSASDRIFAFHLLLSLPKDRRTVPELPPMRS